MNCMFLSTLLSALLFFSSDIQAYTNKDTVKPPYNQQTTYKFPDFFFTPLEYSQSSVTFFLKKIYNDKKYPQYFLAGNFMHVAQGIDFAPHNFQPRFTIRKILSLFQTKLDNIYINPYAFSHLLYEIHPTIARYCNKAQEKIHLIETMKETIGSYLIDNYADFKHNPEKTLHELAHILYTSMDGSAHEEKDISIRELQHAVHLFLVRGLSQLIWNPADHRETWNSVKMLSCQLEKFSEYYMIDTVMFDNLLWTLLDRYGFFLNLVAQDLKPDFFDAVRSDLHSEKAALWLSEERENYITTKYEYLTSILLEAEITAHMHNAQGTSS
ncbi:hypothetical protein H0X06_03330 [Candidatus Dependentiae bacterium]|nr:hypothetical protein [Candidatus Dependentiae bacterium]